MNTADIKKALEAATPGPWITTKDKFFENTEGVEMNGFYIGGGFRPQDAHLIANAPTWLSQLLQEREQMVEALKLICNSTMSMYPDVEHMAADLKLKAVETLKKVGELE